MMEPGYANTCISVVELPYRYRCITKVLSKIVKKPSDQPARSWEMKLQWETVEMITGQTVQSHVQEKSNFIRKIRSKEVGDEAA